MDDTLVSILAVVFLFGTPVILGAIGAALWRFNSLSKFRERERARSLYERLMMEKLDVIKTAVAMGMQQDELTHLDSRLEQLIGAESMRSLLDGTSPQPPQAPREVANTDLDEEIARLKKPSTESEPAS